MIASLLERKIEKRPDKVKLKGRILFLTEDPELIKRQLAGWDLPWDTQNPANHPDWPPRAELSHGDAPGHEFGAVFPDQADVPGGGNRQSAPAQIADQFVAGAKAEAEPLNNRAGETTAGQILERMLVV